MNKKTKFPKRIVLGEGYPWAYGIKDYTQIGLNKKPCGVEPIILDFNAILWNDTLLKYRLVLEIINE
jgi:hypothetical protein